ncbi:hypothetical protein Nepgr_001418 [Nepenthes gracilis]|uniref:Uncharacterized protein n=1 Tax=Nepenthes gracilis TaxID=150966 RepID=A0AAD3P4D9_NEPGR|nr:hypothetical protein Nepgr_001418 [Nepenthes gracilis]
MDGRKVGIAICSPKMRLKVAVSENWVVVCRRSRESARWAAGMRRLSHPFGNRGRSSGLGIAPLMHGLEQFGVVHGVALASSPPRFRMFAGA